MGTLVGVHDGSFKDKLCARTCSAGVVLFCTKQRRLATAACAERTDPRTASSYRGELLGGLLMSLILKAASSLIDENCPPVRLACDNIGAVGHGNNRGKSLKDAQVQADVIHCFRSILSDISFNIAYEHVLGHQDDKVAWDALNTLVQQLNVVADKVAQDYLVRAIHYERGTIRVLGEGRGESSPGPMKYCVQREFRFDLLGCDGGGDEKVDNVCPCCGCKNESTGHITRCTDDGRTAMFYESADLLLDFLHETQMDPRLIDCITQYLERRGEVKMTDIARNHAHFDAFARDIDSLG
eukprot:scaffold182809_cov28-Cyclotella_meneghiniana.AAC.2